MKAHPRRFAPSLALFLAGGCLHLSARDRVLAALRDVDVSWGINNAPPPDYIRLDDESKWIFESAIRRHYPPPPRNAPLLCPGVASAGAHGYAVGARVMSVDGATATAVVSRACARGLCEGVCMGFTLIYEDNYLLVNNNGKWRIVKQLNGEVVVPG